MIEPNACSSGVRILSRFYFCSVFTGSKVSGFAMSNNKSPPPMPTSLADNPDHWRVRGEEMRILAGTIKTAALKRSCSESRTTTTSLQSAPRFGPEKLTNNPLLTWEAA